MKKKVLSVCLALVMLLSVTATPAFAADSAKTATFFQNTLVKAISYIMEGLTGTVNKYLRDADNFVSADSFELENFYEGTTEKLSEPAENARWSLGYDSTSLVPENLDDYDLYLGGFMSVENFFTNDVRGVYDDMKVRTIALSDNSGRGISIFATIDCIGITNADIKQIRERLSSFAKENSINSINIFSTHCHSCIDTEGLWTNSLSKIPHNVVSSLLGWGTVTQGTDPDYMNFLFSKVSRSIKSAVASMQTGTMTFAQKDIGKDYFYNKNRDSASALISELTRFTFTPDNPNVQPTIIANMAAHPDVVGLPVSDDDAKGHMISGDYIYYIGETLNRAGYNFMFFNGAICGIYIGRELTGDGVEINHRVEISQRYGREIGKMLLALTKTKEEIEADDFLTSTTDTPEQMASDEYTLWYEDWQPVSEEPVQPLLNVTLKSVTVPVTNNIMIIAGKCKLANHTVIKDAKNYYISSEIGVVEIGTHKAVLVPGELCQDLVVGGSSLTADGSINHKDFEGKTLSEIFGDDVLVFGLANDAFGYIVPDNDYALGLVYGHYQESLSLGKNTASFLMREYETIA
ncbi:MAG: hypothetical protein ACI4W6_09010 [Acutalibacteraceae bacterium]